MASRLPRSGRRLWVLVAVLAGIAVLVLTDTGSTTPEVVPAAPSAQRSPAPARAQPAPATAAGEVEIAAVQARARAAQVDEAFAALSWRRPVAAPVPKPPLPGAVDAAAPPAPAPALPYTLLGKQRQDQRWQVFLSGPQGSTLVVRQGEVIDGIWRVEGINPPSMRLVHLPTGERQVVRIGEGG